MRRTLLLVVISAALALPAEPAWACTCVPRDDLQSTGAAEVIFTGTAVSSEGQDLGPKITTFAVDTAYKGTSDAEIAVKHHVQSGACGLEFADGERYTVFAYDTTGRLETNSCWPTTPGDIDAGALGLEATPVAQTSEGGRRVDVDEVWPFWIALSGLVFAIGALSMWDTRRRRRGGRSRDTRPN